MNNCKRKDKFLSLEVKLVKSRRHALGEARRKLSELLHKELEDQQKSLREVALVAHVPKKNLKLILNREAHRVAKHMVLQTFDALHVEKDEMESVKTSINILWRRGGGFHPQPRRRHQPFGQRARSVRR